jgi:hypothetical protein
MISIMPDEEFQKLNEEEQNTQWDRELNSMSERIGIVSISIVPVVTWAIRFPRMN